VLAKLIHRFKYDFAQEICGDLVKILLRSGCLKKLEGYGKNACIVPVPLHKKRLNFRGFNQSEVLAEEIFKNTRIKNTEPQAQLKKIKRLTNVKNAFEIKPSAKINPEKIYLLLDDVCTTGSTINECAKILKKYGAKTVIGLTVAKAV
jgi:ComF family protein